MQAKKALISTLAGVAMIATIMSGIKDGSDMLSESTILVGDTWDFVFSLSRVLMSLGVVWLILRGFYYEARFREKDEEIDDVVTRLHLVELFYKQRIESMESPQYAGVVKNKDGSRELYTEDDIKKMLENFKSHYREQRKKKKYFF